MSAKISIIAPTHKFLALISPKRWREDGLILYFIASVKSHSESIKNEEECKIADLCVHDKVPMCGIDSCGEMRTFIDTCDMHEFNCDSKKDFKQRPIHECWVTCKRGRSFKKPEYRTDCNINAKGNRV